MNEDLVGWCAALTAMTGAGLLAMRSHRWSKWGFVAFLESNVLWITWAIYTGTTHLLVQNLGFTVTSVIGIVNWFRRPQADGISPDRAAVQRG